MKSAAPDEFMNWLGCDLYTIFTILWQGINFDTQGDVQMKKKAHVRFYTKPGCHLCEEAKREIERAGCREEFTLEEINIAEDAALLERFGLEIPVVFINDVKAFKYQLTASEFKRKLRRLS
jgi:glutaredoxin